MNTKHNETRIQLETSSPLAFISTWDMNEMPTVSFQNFLLPSVCPTCLESFSCDILLRTIKVFWLMAFIIVILSLDPVIVRVYGMAHQCHQTFC